jgi:hypothetical protein
MCLVLETELGAVTSFKKTSNLVIYTETTNTGKGKHRKEERMTEGTQKNKKNKENQSYVVRIYEESELGVVSS